MLYNAKIHISYWGILNKLLNILKKLNPTHIRAKLKMETKKRATFERCHELCIPYAGTYVRQQSQLDSLEIKAGQKGIRLESDGSGRKKSEENKNKKKTVEIKRAKRFSLKCATMCTVQLQQHEEGKRGKERGRGRARNNNGNWEKQLQLFRGKLNCLI